MRKQRQHPLPKKIANGLFLNFEGFAPHSKQDIRAPAMCGYRIGGEGEVTQVVFSRTLRAAGRASGIEVCDDWKQFIKSLLKENAGRKIFAFSEHEQKVLKLATGHEIRRRYENLRKIAKRWRRIHMPELSADENTLLDFLKAAGISIPKNYGKGQVTEKLRNVRKYSSSTEDWSAAPNEARRDWKNILKHNAFDVSSMFDLLSVIEHDETKSTN